MISYEKQEIPKNYICSRCAMHGVKLWRQYNTRVSDLQLVCGSCAAPDAVFDGSGRSKSSLMPGHDVMTDQIEDVVGKTGSLVPAVPTIEADTYWGYSSVPQAGCAWWRSLPNKVGEALRPFYIAPEDLAAEQRILEDHRRFESKPDQFKRDTVFLVEATSFEQHLLWLHHASDASAYDTLSKTRLTMGLAVYAETEVLSVQSFEAAEQQHHALLPDHNRHVEQHRVKWEQLSPGSVPTIGTDNRRPICISCFWVRLNGQIVMFYHPTSRIVDWEKIEKWLEAEYVHVPTYNGGRRAQCDAGNFHSCLHALKEINARKGA